MKTIGVWGECIKSNAALAWQARDEPFYEDKIALVKSGFQNGLSSFFSQL